MASGSRRFFQAGEKAAQRREAIAETRSVTSHVGDQVAQPRQVGQLETFLTPEEVQAILRLPSVKRVYDLIHQHNLPARRIGRLYRIEQTEFQAWTRGEHVHAERRPRLVTSR